MARLIMTITPYPPFFHAPLEDFAVGRIGNRVSYNLVVAENNARFLSSETALYVLGAKAPSPSEARVFSMVDLTAIYQVSKT